MGRRQRCCCCYWSSPILPPLFLLLLSLSFPPSFTQPINMNPDSYYDDCSKNFSFHCGNIQTDIKYPFSAPGRSEFCGHPDFVLSCEDENKLVMSIGDDHKRYHVMEKIDYQNRVLQVIDAQLDDATTSSSCPEKLSNTTLDFSLFSYLDGNKDINLTLFLNCKKDYLSKPLNDFPHLIDLHLLFPTKCSGDLLGQYSYFTLQSMIDGLPLSYLHDNCLSIVLLPVYNISLIQDMFAPDKLAKNANFSNALRVGFGLTWNVGKGWCDDQCRKSRGICGSNVSELACFCPKGTVNNGYSCTTHSTSIAPGSGLSSGLTWNVGKGWCDDQCRKSGGICGSNVADSEPACLCPKGTVNNGYSCTTHSTSIAAVSAEPDKERKKKLMIIGSVSGVGVILLISCLWSFMCYCKKRQQHTSSTVLSVSCWHSRTSGDQTIEAFLQKHGTLPPKRYSYLEVKRMTESFHHKLGEGGFGSVYKGTLTDGCAVAVKLLNNTNGDGEEFLNEVASIGRTSHINIVSLLGFCFQGSKRALIYDFMSNGSLEKYIYAEDPRAILGWEKLFQIAIGIARGLEYLHRGCNTRIVHFDIKPHNILLDEDFSPKISDFGLAKLGTHKESILSMAGARGTVGFIAPEVFSRNFGVVSTKSDVYSYGMMLLEMAGGRRNVKVIVDRTSEIYFPHWIYDHLDQDEWLQYCEVTLDEQEMARKLIIVGLFCIQTRPECRPTMSQVAEMLQGNITDLKIPPKPYLSSPPMSSSTCSMMPLS